MKNNPFKVVGSYIGLGAGLLFGSFQMQQTSVTGCAISGACEQAAFVTPGILGVFVYGMVGFILGWIVHVLIRDIIKDKR